MNSEPEVVNINQADHATLAQLPGIGPTLADRIIEYRETAGPFQNALELSEIHGISQAMVHDILPLLTTGEEAEGDSDNAAEEHENGEDDSGLPEEEPEEESGGVESEHEAAEEEPLVEAEEPAPEEDDLAALAREIRFYPEEPVEGDAGANEEDVSEETAMPALAEELSDGEETGEPSTGSLEAAEGAIAVTASPSVGLEALDPFRGESRAGCSIQAVTAGAVLGGVFGLLLTMLILYFLNGGMLQFAGARSLRTLEKDTATRLNDAQVNRDELVTQMETLSGLVQELNAAVSAVATQQVEISRSISGTEEEVDKLESTVLEYDQKINSVAEAAENFNVFLGGLQELIGDMALTPEVEGRRSNRPADQSATADLSATIDDLAPEITMTPSPRLTKIGPTRTPRPTGAPVGTQAASP